MKIYINGQYYGEEEAKISVFDHGLLYGDGVFEGIRAYNGRVFKLREHIKRLYDSAKVILLKIPLDPSAMIEAVLETCRQNELRDGYIRLIVTRGIGTLGLNPFKCRDPQIIIIAGSIQLYPPELYEQGLRIVTVPTTRNHPNAVNPAIKSLNYLNNILAKIEAVTAGVEEAVMLNTEGYVAECTGDNIFIVKGKKLITPPISAGALPGITRTVVMELAQKEGMEVAEETLTRYDFYVADECFLTGTAAEIVPVTEVDRRPVGSGSPGPITRKLMEAYRKLTQTSGEPIWPE